MNAEVMVFDGLLSLTEPIQCRSYLFFQRWLEIFVTFDANLALLPDPTSAFPYAFNCDITTPYHRVGQHLFTTDLGLDVVVAADGATYQGKDADEFEQWYTQGAFGVGWYTAAQRELTALIQLLETHQFIQFLTDIAPFPTQGADVPLSTLVQEDLNSTEFIHHPQYPRQS